MDEYTVCVEGVIREALGLDDARGAGDLPAGELTAPDAWAMGDAELLRGVARLAAFDPWAAEQVRSLRECAASEAGSSSIDE